MTTKTRAKAEGSAKTSPVVKVRDWLRRSAQRGLLKQIISKICVYALLIAFSYIFLYPLLKMLTMSFMGTKDLIDPEVSWIPFHPTFSNIRIAAQVLLMPESLLYSFLISSLLAVSQTLVSSLTGFAFARYEFPLKKLLFVCIILSFIVPIPLVVIPRVMIFTTLQNTLGIQFIGTIIPQLLFALLGQGVNSAILILIFFNFFRNIPKALYEAASIDGAVQRQIFWHITIKLSLTIIITVFLFAFVWNWNETYQTGTFLRDSVPLVPQRLGIFDSVFSQRGADLSPGPGGGQAKVNEAMKMAGTMLSILPHLILYFFTQRMFIEGIENTGIK